MKPATPISPQSVAVGIATMKVEVLDVVTATGIAWVLNDKGQKFEVPYRVQRTKGRIPRVGEIWYIDRSLGPWTFAGYVAKDDAEFTTYPEKTTFSDGIVIPIDKQVNIGSSTSDASFASVRSLGAAAALSVRTSGDTVDRLYVPSSGALWFGSGSASVDTNLYRSAANTLKTDDLLIAAGGFQGPTQTILTTGSIANTTSEGVIGTFSGGIPANAPVDSAWRTTIFGSASGTTSSPTLTLRVKIDGTGGVDLVSFLAMTFLAAGGTRRWVIQGDFAVDVAGASGDLDCIFRRYEHVQQTGPAGTQTIMGGATTNLTVAHDVVVTAQWGTASSSNIARTLSGTLQRIHTPN